MSITTKPTTTDFQAADRSLQNRRVLIAPLCLCLVAALHGYRVMTLGQTPWKGGGFGMFSTIDGENARSVRCWLVTEQGERALELPAELTKRADELRAAPSQDSLQYLATRLSKRQWIDPVLAHEQLAALLQAEPPGQPLTAIRLHELRQQKLAVIDLATKSARTTPLTSLPRGAESSSAVPFRAVRVELWKYSMPAGTNNLENKLLLSATKFLEEPAQ
ncbi:hypothetical protein ETAA8_13990 [Anatilimnocola aggregata]|uniref:Uncharacterized protein n=1 Tax=Anatilimnocola aggregata TaxID=2528021 RepID=A0A517Y7Z5_9BACT|nr:hypothetical protein [Anatilimnocola aggregata]QDU26321.1 hypothetical protein ETAA8_13990 [Anatilimnocola aggregata]